MFTFNSQTIGTCSHCGGAVQTPVMWWGVVPPTPICSSCGAVPKANHGPVIPMVPPNPFPFGFPWPVARPEPSREQRARERYAAAWRQLTPICFR